MYRDEVPPKVLMNENWQGYVEAWVYANNLTWWFPAPPLCLKKEATPLLSLSLETATVLDDEGNPTPRAALNSPYREHNPSAGTLCDFQRVTGLR